MVLRLPRRNGAGHWIQLLPIPLHGPDHSIAGIVHCALDVSTAHVRVDRYLNRVADHGGDTARIEALGPREHQILDLLSRDLGLREIARALNISHATVRNHVQHILTKLGVHSTKEAIVVFLLALERGAPSA